MNASHRDGREHRVPILVPTTRDAILTQTLLGKAGIAVVICRDAEQLCREAAVGAGCLLVAQEAITSPTHRALRDLVAHQAPWSDLPLLVLTQSGADSVTMSPTLDKLGNVSLLERPIRVANLVNAVRVALRARDRQYEIRDRIESQSLLAAIVASSDDAIISKTLDGTVLSWNAGAERMFGYSAAEMIGQPIVRIIPPDRYGEERMILERLQRGERIEHFDTVRVSKSGKLIDISVTVSPVRDAENRIVAASKVARDVSDRKRTEQALREADRRKDEFLATLAHELRNPLAPIRNALHVLRLSGSSDANVENAREIMERQVDHMVRLVDELMEVSRITRGKIDLHKQRVDLAAVISAAVETSQPLIDAAGHHLSIQIPSESLCVEADTLRLTQVFSNLLNNAAKYAEKPGQIWVTVRRAGNIGIVSVRDDGIGIPGEMLPRVFEMFTQIDGSVGRSQGGLGIGLTLVRSLVRMHGGSVAAHSAGAGRGSEFVVRLPLVDGAAELAIDRQNKPTAIMPLRVLVVDDNHDAADSLGTLLRLFGAETSVVHDGRSALSSLETFVPDMVLLDIGMPGMNGYEVARRIREQPRLRDVVLIALTGWGQEDDRRQSQAAGFDHHLIKPPDLDALQTLMSAVGRRRKSDSPSGAEVKKIDAASHP